jgi:hypothetical protein
MKRLLDDWGVTIGMALGASLLMALVGGGGDGGFGRSFVYALVGFATLTASMVSTILIIGRVSGDSGDGTGKTAIGFLVGAFVTTPIAFWIVFGLLDRVFGQR